MVAPVIRPLHRRELLKGAAALAGGIISVPVQAAADCAVAVRNWVPSERLIARVQTWMQVGGVPGVGIATAVAGQPAWNGSFGVTNVATGEPVTHTTLFEAASMTKPAFAYVAMKLVDEGKLELDRPLVDYRRPPYLGADKALETITVRDVLRHSTGLPNWADGPLVTIAEPGTAYTYSGEGFVWLQLIVEQLTGEGTGAAMDRVLFAPAGMTRTTMGWDGAVARAAAFGHGEPELRNVTVPEQPTRTLGNALLPIAIRLQKPIASWTYEDQVRAMAQAVPATRPTPHELLINAAGGMMTTPTDYVKLMLLMMERRPRAAWQISENARRTMLSRQFDTAGPNFYRGLGWQREDPPGSVIFEHSGSNYGIFHSLAVGDARSGNAVAIFTNGANGSALAARVVRELAGLDLLKFLA